MSVWMGFIQLRAAGTFGERKALKTPNEISVGVKAQAILYLALCTILTINLRVALERWSARVLSVAPLLTRRISVCSVFSQELGFK